MKRQGGAEQSRALAMQAVRHPRRVQMHDIRIRRQIMPIDQASAEPRAMPLDLNGKGDDGGTHVGAASFRGDRNALCRSPRRLRCEQGLRCPS